MQTLLWVLTLVEMTYCANLEPTGFPTDFFIMVDKHFIGEAGLCIWVPCYFTVPQNTLSEPVNRTWFKGDPQNPSVEVPCFNTNIVYPDNTFECNFILENLVQGKSDGKYRFKLEWGQGRVHVFPETVMIIVKELTQKPTMTISPLIVGQQAKLSCQIPGNCVRPLADVEWTGIDDGTIVYEAIGIPGKEIIYSIMLFNPELKDHNAKVTCTVIFNGNIRTETSGILKVQYAPTILNSSHCSLLGDELSCVCISDGVPLPQVFWPLLDVVSDYNSIASSEESYSVSSISVSGFSQLNSTVKCISQNVMGVAQREIQVRCFDGNPKGNLSASWIFCILSLVVNIILSVAITVLYLRKRRGHKTPKDDKHVYMMTNKREECLYETINKRSEKF